MSDYLVPDLKGFFFSGEISMAISGGVNFILDPETFVHLSSARMASPTGKCHTFSEKADGYVRGEGCGIVILKRLSDVNTFIYDIMLFSMILTN